MRASVKRIARAEEALSRAASAVSGLERALEAYTAAEEDFALLERYLNSDERRADVLADEAGRLPRELKRGVLSEDGIWNLLERRDALTRELRALAADAPSAPTE